MNRALLKKAASSGATKGWDGFLWILKIFLPISLGIALLDWSGVVHRIDFLLQPILSLLSLPAIAALPLMIGMVAGIYPGSAAMVVLPFTKAQMTLMAIFMMICHGLIQEGVIQGKSGLHPLKATLFRLGAAVVTVMAVAPFLDNSTTVANPAGSAGTISRSFMGLIQNWAFSTSILTLKILAIIMGVMILLEIFKVMGWIRYIIVLLTPLLRLMGLTEKVGFLWITGAIFGLSYGAVVIVEEGKQGHINKEDLEDLHLSIGINHSIIEDPLFFMSLGLNGFWVWVPRLIVATLAVHLSRLWQKGGHRQKWNPLR
jgi:hypothetical protein